MTNTDITSIVTFAYLACGVFALAAYVITEAKSPLRGASFGLFIVVWVAHTVAILLRWFESHQLGYGHAPLSNLYESLVFFSWSVGLALIVVRYRFKADLIVVLGIPLTFIILAPTFLLDQRIKPLIPALQSNWLAIHVLTCFLGYACFTVSFIAAGVMLALGGASEGGGASWVNPGLLDQIVYRSVMIGFPLLSLGIITGAAWADYAWGSYWSWDPKETWSLVTWFVYAAFLHARLARGWRGHRTAFLSIMGFAAVLFTYFGVNYLPGLHSYF
jgi:cytochrome c-type biogenesis protein CcsB